MEATMTQNLEDVAEDNVVNRQRITKTNGHVQSPLETYLREISETELLTADQEKQLAREISEGNDESREHMIRANLRLVVNIARGYTKKGLSLQDLIEEGNLGLIRAVEGFDPTIGTRFSTYASYWIKQSIKRALINQKKGLRIPAYMAEVIAKFNQVKAKLKTNHKREPTFEEIVKKVGIPKRKARILRHALSLSDAEFTTLNPDDSTIEILDHNDPAIETETNDLIRKVQILLEQLDTRENTIITLRFGLEDEEPQTLKEIGEQLGLTRERVRQIESEALKKLGNELGILPRHPR